MTLSTSQRKLIDILILSNQYLSTYELSNQTGIHQRQVREDIKGIKQYLERNGYTLLSIRSKGYLIQANYPNTLENLKEIMKEMKKNTSPAVEYPEQRIAYLNTRLAYTDDYLKLDDLADELLISRSTILNDFKALKKRLNKYDLKLINKPNHGIKLMGEEIKKRQSLCDIIFDNQKESLMIYQMIRANQSNQESLEYQICSILTKYDIDFNDVGCFDFLLNISVVLNRLASHHTLKANYSEKYQLPSKYLTASKEIAKLIQDKYNLILNQFETNQIAQEIMSKCSLKEEDSSIFVEKDQIIEEIINELYTQLRYNYFDRDSFHNAISMVLESVLCHIIFQTKQRTSIYQENVAHFSLQYSATKICTNILEKKYKTKIHQGDLTRIASMFHIEMIKKMHVKRNILILGSLNDSNEELLRYFIKNKHPYYVKSVKSIPLYKLNDIPDFSYDVIISTIPLGQGLPKPNIVVSPLLTSADHTIIKTFLEKLSIKENLEFYFDSRLFITCPKDQILIQIKKSLKECNSLSKYDPTKQIKDGLKKNYFDYKNGIATFSFLNENFGFDVIIPIIIHDDKNTKLVLAISQRKPGSALLDAIHEQCSKLTPADIDEYLQEPTYIKLIDLIKTPEY